MIIEDKVFDKTIVPWFDSEIVCYITIFFLLLISVFSIIGISVVNEHMEYYKLIWVPELMLVMSLGVLISIIVRLIMRYINSFKLRYLKSFDQISVSKVSPKLFER
ncbi:MAG: hypothetical protein HQK76_13240 [Desulfobacterales bacterium]|nr:hypothetical protein [Desulfobacterales bacterium]